MLNRLSLTGENRIILTFIILALLVYFLPWVVIRNTASLSMGAYDLAEWASLHPVVRETAPGLLTTLLLRLPLPCLKIMTIIFICRLTKKSVTRALFIMTFAASLLPPIEFFADPGRDMNYAQQFLIAISIVIISVMCIRFPAMIRAKLSVFVLTVFALITSLLGLKLTFDLINSFNLPAQVGPGAILLPVILLTITLIEIRELKNKTE